MRDCRGNYSFGNSLGNPRNAVAHNLAASISDVGWGTFANFLAYKLERKGAKLVEIDRWFPSSKLCSNCFYQVSEMSLDIRGWTCPHCGTHHDRDGNAAINIRAEGIRMRACGRFSRLCCRRGGKTKAWTKVSSSALAIDYRSRHCTRYSGSVWVVHYCLAPSRLERQGRKLCPSFVGVAYNKSEL
jgi:putative transposase